MLERPLFFEIVLAISLLLAAKLGFGRIKHPFDAVGPQAAQTAAVRPLSIAALVPNRLLRSDPFHRSVSGLLIVASLAWLCRIAPRVTSVLTVLLLIMQMSLMYSFNSVLHHRYHLIAQVLIVFCGATQFIAPNLRAAARTGRYFQTPLYPRWVFTVGVFLVGLSYTLSGIAKLREAGLEWADGVALQSHVWKTESSGRLQDEGLGAMMRREIIENRTLARALSIATLFLECGAVAGVLNRHVRRLFGIGLIAFHFGAWYSLGIMFPANAIYLFLFFAVGLEPFLQRSEPTTIAPHNPATSPAS